MPKDFFGNYTLPNGVEEIDPGAFSGCTGLTSVTIAVGKIRELESSGVTRVAILLLLPGDVRLELAWIKAGTFTMGSPADELWRSFDEKTHTVTITKPFFIGKYEVTQRQWRAVMGDDPSRFKGDDLPVEQVSWHDAMKFCR